MTNPRDLGARADGVTDDAPAIQRAVAAARGEVYLPAGTYQLGKPGQVTPTIQLGSGTTLRGDGAATVLRRADGGSSAPMIRAQGEGITIADLALDGARGSARGYLSNEQGIWLSGARDCAISRVWAYGQRTNGIVLEYCQGVSVSQCIARDNLKNGIYLSGSDRIALNGCIGHDNGSGSVGVGSSFGIACSWHCSLSACTGWGDSGASLVTGRDTQYLSVTGGSYEGVDASAEPVGMAPPGLDRSGALYYDGKTKLGTCNSVFTGLIVRSRYHGVRFIGGGGNLVANCIIRSVGLNGLMLHGSSWNVIQGNLISDVGRSKNPDYAAGIVVVADDGWSNGVGNVLAGNDLPGVAQPIHVYALQDGSVAGTRVV